MRCGRRLVAKGRGGDSVIELKGRTKAERKGDEGRIYRTDRPFLAKSGRSTL